MSRNMRQAYQPLDRDVQRRFVPLLRINHSSSLSTHYSPLSADWLIMDRAYGAQAYSANFSDCLVTIGYVSESSSAYLFFKPNSLSFLIFSSLSGWLWLSQPPRHQFPSPIIIMEVSLSIHVARGSTICFLQFVHTKSALLYSVSLSL
jgi:hypothetical protein